MVTLLVSGGNIDGFIPQFSEKLIIAFGGVSSKENNQNSASFGG